MYNCGELLLPRRVRVSLGGVATLGGSNPQIGDLYCVKSSYISYGSSSNWEYIWRDHGMSGASSDVSIYEALVTIVATILIET